MTLKDKIAIILSMLALIISATSTYVQHFHVVERVDAHILSSARKTTIGNGYSIIKTIDVAVVNKGNRQAAIRKGYYFEKPHPYNLGLAPRTRFSELPAVVKPGEILLLSMNIPLFLLVIVRPKEEKEEENDWLNSDEESPFKKGSETFPEKNIVVSPKAEESVDQQVNDNRIGLSFSAIDSNGSPHRFTIDLYEIAYPEGERKIYALYDERGTSVALIDSD